VQDAGESVLLDMRERGVPLHVSLGVGGGEVVLGLEGEVPVHDAGAAEHLSGGGRVGGGLDDDPDDGRAHEAQRVGQAQQLAPATAPGPGRRPRGGDHDEEAALAALGVVVAHVHRGDRGGGGGDRVGGWYQAGARVDVDVDGDAGCCETVRRVGAGGLPGGGGREAREESHDETEGKVEQRLLPQVAAGAGPPLFGPVRRRARARARAHGPEGMEWRDQGQGVVLGRRGGATTRAGEGEALRRGGRLEGGLRRRRNEYGPCEVKCACQDVNWRRPGENGSRREAEGGGW
jgi:hypothetical protein